MNEHEKIDLGALDPSRDPVRWEEMISAVTRRALAARPAPSVARQLVTWARPTLAAAAVMAVLIWILVWLRAPPSPTTAQQQQPAGTLAEWAQNDEIPSTATILEVLGEDHVSR